MKDSHLYQRLTDPTAFRNIMIMFRSHSVSELHDMYDNLSKDASDHPKFIAIKEIYESRLHEKD